MDSCLLPIGSHDPNKTTLYCFPHAGGSAAAFYNWSQSIAGLFNLVAIELPGRGSRFAELPQEDLLVVTEEIGAAILSFTPYNYFFLGHSMGAILAFEVAKFIGRKGGRLPKHLFLVAQPGPRIVEKEPKYNLEDEAFISYLKSEGGTSENILNDHDLMELLLPMLRVDQKIADTYAFQVSAEKPLECPIDVLAGLDDRYLEKELMDWKQETKDRFQLAYFAGGHFFLHEAPQKIVNHINEQLT